MVAKTLEQIESEALELSAEQRLALGERLLESVPLDPTVQEAWDVEIMRRIAEVECGSAQGRPADDVITDIENKYGWTK